MTVRALWSNEPVVWISGFLVAAGNVAGVHWTDGQVQAVLVALGPLVAAVVARSRTVPVAKLPPPPPPFMPPPVALPPEPPDPASSWSFPG